MHSPLDNEDLAIPPGELQFIQQVGKGGYGEVWKGKWRGGKGGGITVAIKKIQANRLNARAQREVISELRHPHILTIFGGCFCEEELWIVMEYMEGGSLFDWLHSEWDMTWDLRLKLAQQAAVGLNVLHSSTPSVIHRDVKSLNFMVSLDGNTLKLIDFGLSKVSSKTAQYLSSNPREVIGTVKWGAPETFEYPPLWTPKADIYSLGVTFYEIASRKVPFEEVNDGDRIISIVQRKIRPELPPECPEDFAKIIRECWHDNPDYRPTSLELIAKLEAAIDTYSSINLSPAPGPLAPPNPFVMSRSAYSAVPYPTAPGTSPVISSTDSVSAALSIYSATSASVTPPTSRPTTPSIALSSSSSFSSITSSSPRPSTPHPEINEIWHPPTSVGCFDTAEMVSTLAGCGEVGNTDGNGALARFKYPWGICINPRDHCLYICDSDNSSIRKLTMQGDVMTFAKLGSAGEPCGITMDYKNNVFYVSTMANTIVKITASGTVSIFAGASSHKGSSDRNGGDARFNFPVGITIDQQTSNIFVCERFNHMIRKITPEGEVSTIAGSPRSGKAEGSGRDAQFYHPRGICFDATNQCLLVCDYLNHSLRRVQLNGEVSTLCEVEEPVGVVITANSTILVTSALHRIYKVTRKEPDGYEVSVLAGATSKGSGKQDGGPQESCFNCPLGVEVDEGTSSCYVSDLYNNAIRKISFVTHVHL